MENLAGFAEAAHARLRDDDPALRKSYVRQFVERIEVDDDEVRITDPTPASPRRRWAPSSLACPECPVSYLVGGPGRTHDLAYVIDSNLLSGQQRRKVPTKIPTPLQTY